MFLHDSLTKEQAIAIAEAGEWRTWPDERIVQFQLFQDRLCMDFSRYHAAVEAVLGRPVFTHEFGTVGRERLIAEYLGKASAPTMEEIIGLIPAEKRIIGESLSGCDWV